MAGAFLGAALGAGLLLAVWIAWYLWRHEEGMGLGDVKMLAAIGAFLGWKGVLVALFLGALSGAVVGLALMAFRGLDFKAKLPFGVFLALGGVIALFAGEALVRVYRRLRAALMTATPSSPRSTRPPRRLGLRREVLILLPVALLLLVVLSTFTLLSYRNAIALLAVERQQEAARMARAIADRLAAASPGVAVPGPLVLPPAARGIALVDPRGEAVAELGELPAGGLLDPVGGRPVTHPLGVGPDDASPDAVIGFAP